MKIDKVASIADIVLGLWLLVSMLFWRSSPEQMANVGAVGVLSVALGAVAYRGRAWARWVVAVLAIWLFVSPWALSRATTGMVVNAVTIGTLLFGFSALPTGRGRALGENPL